MTGTLPSLANSEWLVAPAVRQIFAVLEGAGEETRVVGGAVRNALMHLPVADIDFATTATPDKVTALAGAEGIKAVPTGIEHGTVTLVVGGRGFEVTTLREDVETDGRRAVVRFGRDWEADARRRDFTVNALSVDSGGTVHDPIGGYDDVLARRVRFIGDADRRIAEDRLRILRLFRFHAEYGAGAIDTDGLSAAIRARTGLRDLSDERIGQEMRKLVVAPRAPETIALMQDFGILPIVLAGVGYVVQFERLAMFEADVGVKPVPSTRIAVLACRVEEDVLRVTERLRLANAERSRMQAMLAAARSLAPLPDARDARRALYAHGAETYRDGVAHAFAWNGRGEPAWRDLFGLPDRWTAPKFPLGGRDITGGGMAGPAVGETLRAIEAWWIDQDFAPNEAALRSRLQQMIAAAQ
ncbi:MAG: CCA tRNA nucleotidyltransferase [Bauldia sp.]|nr:CCA tRNA nucleotidyltransferase [Bauldia sp.]